MNRLVDLDEIDRLEHEQETAHYKNTESKSQIKREMLEITEFGRDLVSLSNDNLKKLPLDDTLLYYISQAKTMQRIALKRQIQYIGKLLRKIDNLEEIKQSYLKITNKDKDNIYELRRFENIRNNLLDQDLFKSTLEDLVKKFPELDIQRLRQLVRNYHKEKNLDKGKKISKEIFQIIKTYCVEDN